MNLSRLLRRAVLVLLMVGCTPETPSPTPTPTLLPTDTPSPTPAPSVWVAPYLPDGFIESLILPEGWLTAPDAASASLRLEVGDGDVRSRWVYALAAPFPTLTDSVTLQQVRDAWQGLPDPVFASQLLMDQDTLDLFSAWWGQPGAAAVRVLPAGELVNAAWQAMSAWAILPFEQLEPRWKVLAVDGTSPLQADFDLEGYGLSVPIRLEGSGELSLPESNRDPQKLTTVVTTGTTAMVRGTAVLMEMNGIRYPAEQIAPLLQSADILHISNEIPFFAGCPAPVLGTDSLIFCSPSEYIELLEFIGTDVVELTGDHFANYGPEAMRLTIQMYRDRGWQVYGGGETLQDGLEPALFTHNGNWIAFLGCNAKGGGYATASATSPGAAACANGGYESIHEQIRQLKQQGTVVFASFQHQEYYQYTVLPQYRTDFTAMVDAGADVVLGSQGHQPQNMEFYAGDFIHYGTGNLFFDQVITPGGDQRPLDRAFIDRHIIYDGRYISTELITIKFIDFAQSRLMTPDERSEFLETLFRAGGWQPLR